VIIFIANQFVGDKISTGGDVLFIEMLIRASEGYECVVIAPSLIYNEILTRAPNVKFISSDKRLFSTTASTVIGGSRTIVSYIKRAYVTYKWLYKNKDSADIYLTGDFICNSLPVYFTSKKYKNIYSNFYHRNPKPINRHGNLYFVSLMSRFIQGLSLSLIKKFSVITFVLSEIGKKELLLEGFDKSKIIISGAGVSDNILKYNSPIKNQNQIIFVGRLNITKGVYDLIDILSILNNVGVDYICYLVGAVSDYDRKRIIKLLKKNKIELKVKILGYVDNEKKFELIASSQVLAFPSKEEGYGIAVQEALKLGTSVVCYDLPVLKSLFGSVNMISYAKHSNKKDFANKLQLSMMRNKKYTSDNSLLSTWSDVYNLQFKRVIDIQYFNHLNKKRN